MATSRAKAISWVAITIVMPAAASARTISSTSPTSSGSSAAVISSSSSSVGLVQSARTSAARCCWPPESRSGCLAAWSARPKRSSSSSAALLGLGPRQAVHLARGEGAVVEDGQVREEVVGLEDHAHPAAHRPGVDARVGDLAAVERDDAVVDVLEQVQAAQQRRLARARRRRSGRSRRAAATASVDVVEDDAGRRTTCAGPRRVSSRAHSAPARSRSASRAAAASR